MTGKTHDGEDEASLFMRHDLAPVCRNRIVSRCAHHLEILGTIRVGQDEEDIAAFLKVILQAGLARGHELRLEAGSVGRQDAVFRGLVIMDGDQDVAVVARAATAHEEPRIALLVDEPVGARIRTDGVKQQF